MKVFAFACLFVCASASYLPAAPIAVHSKLLSTGTSQSSRTQDSNGNYAFQYSEQNPTGGSSRNERGNGWATHGSYELNVADGRKRVVNYVADASGFRAAISTNEPGTANQPAADTSIASPYAAPEPVKALPVLAPLAPLAYAPAPEPALLAAPIAYAPAPEPIKLAVASVPAVSSYSTSINHAAPAAYAIAEPAALALPALPAPIVQTRLSGWN